MKFKQFLVLNALIISAALLLSGCSSASNSDDNNAIVTQLDGATYTTLVDNGLTHASSSVAGNGTIIFNTPLDAVASKASFELSFSLFDGGSLAFNSYANNALSGGVTYTFTRSGTALTVTLGAENNTETITSAFSSVSASGNINLQIDLHNDETPNHTLAWSGSDFSEGAALFNSENGPATPGNGTGLFWGFALVSANVNTALKGEPKFVEE